MDINDLKIGREGTFIPPFKSNINIVKSYENEGYDSIFFADHILNWVPESIWTPDITNLATVYPTPHLIYDVFSMMTATALNTKKIHIGTGVTEPFRRNPAVLAQKFLTLDELSRGRVILGIGTGEKGNTVPYGIKWENPVGRLEEAITIIKKLWESDKKIDYDGNVWKLKNALLRLNPFKKGKLPPIWIAARGPRMLDITGRLGDGWLPIILKPEVYKEKLGILRKSAQKAGRDPNDITPALIVCIITDEKKEEVDKMLENPITKNNLIPLYNEDFKPYGLSHPLGEDIDGTLEFIPTHYDKDSMLEILEKIPTKMCSDFYLNGTPDEVIGQIEDYAKAGVKHIVLFNCTILCGINKIPSSNKCMKTIIDYFKN
ncbi:MAG: LLM class flavin-dependent oxidoreductase [Candidatus Hodarchaeota archaeon]